MLMCVHWDNFKHAHSPPTKTHSHNYDEHHERNNTSYLSLELSGSSTATRTCGSKAKSVIMVTEPCAFTEIKTLDAQSPVHYCNLYTVSLFHKLFEHCFKTLLLQNGQFMRTLSSKQYFYQSSSSCMTRKHHWTIDCIYTVCRPTSQEHAVRSSRPITHIYTQCHFVSPPSQWCRSHLPGDGAYLPKPLGDWPTSKNRTRSSSVTEGTSYMMHTTLMLQNCFILTLRPTPTNWWGDYSRSWFNALWTERLCNFRLPYGTVKTEPLDRGCWLIYI